MRCFGLLGWLLLSCALALDSRAADWKTDLKENIESRIKLTGVGIDNFRITQPGTVLAFKKGGVSGDLSSDTTFSKTTIEDGEVKQPKGLVAVIQNKKTTHVFNPGEKVYLWKTAMNDNELALFLISCDAFAVQQKGSTQQVRYKALLDFKFPKGYLPTADFAKVKDVIETVLSSEDQAQTTPKSISVGQTSAEVEAALGKPEKVVNLGEKKIYIYKDMKIVFANDKVADVQ